MDELDEVVEAVSVPVQAVGGLTIRQAIECPAHGAPLVVLGAPLVIDADDFKPASNDLHAVLQRDLRARFGRRRSERPTELERIGAITRCEGAQVATGRRSDAATENVRTRCSRPVRVRTRCDPRAVQRCGMRTQQAVVQYALTPMAVELREVPVPEIGATDVLLEGGRRVGVRVRRAPGVRHALVAGEHPGDAGPRVRRHRRRRRARGHGLQAKATASSARRPPSSAAPA